MVTGAFFLDLETSSPGVITVVDPRSGCLVFEAILCPTRFAIYQCAVRQRPEQSVLEIDVCEFESHLHNSTNLPISKM